MFYAEGIHSYSVVHIYSYSFSDASSCVLYQFEIIQFTHMGALYALAVYIYIYIYIYIHYIYIVDIIDS
jgi:hypothetical protein